MTRVWVAVCLFVGMTVAASVLDLEAVEYYQRGKPNNLSKRQLLGYARNSAQNRKVDVPHFHLCGSETSIKGDYTEHVNNFCLQAGFGGEIFLFQFGDHHNKADSSMIIKKARKIGDDGIIFPLRLHRHFGPVKEVGGADIPWEKKADKLFWRGCTTSTGIRKKYVWALADRGYDVRFHKIVQGRSSWAGKGKKYVDLSKYPMADMLKNKYLFSVQGNDVATNLKWLLASNSLVIMPTPTVETWAMEGRLEPWVHFVPLDNPAEIDNVTKWLKENDGKAKAIAQKASEFMEVFTPERNAPIAAHILEVQGAWLRQQLANNNISKKEILDLIMSRNPRHKCPKGQPDGSKCDDGHPCTVNECLHGECIKVMFRHNCTKTH
eukprot:TRINITY_DN8909_c0_g1_i2.p1 TRINITY_DN8909_c0_g1~~TRINITY_DN8909_c0_g1_i2.p1  ORF type:complete len:391 (-),score=61.40 TRINITY_DN8909_c0_g1_i2:26-1162(-)